MKYTADFEIFSKEDCKYYRSSDLKVEVIIYQF